MTKEDLMQIQELMRAELAPIHDQLKEVDKRLNGIDKRIDGIDKRLDEIDERLDRLEESAEITRTATNELCKWAENVAIIPAVNVKFPTN